jgi:hypothetical protein
LFSWDCSILIFLDWIDWIIYSFDWWIRYFSQFPDFEITFSSSFIHDFGFFRKERFPSLFGLGSCEGSETDSGGFDGIISYLTRKHCGHVLDRGVISITASSCGSHLFDPLHHIAFICERIKFMDLLWFEKYGDQSYPLFCW